MEPKKNVTWKDLRVGLLALSSLILIGVAVTLISGVSGIHFFTETLVYRTFFPEANGLKAGSEVWLAGLEVGEVKSVRFSDPNDRDVLDAIEVVLEVDLKVASRIRKDSVTSLRTIGLLGDKYVEISPGTAEAPQIFANGSIQGISLSTLDEFVGVGRNTAKGFNELMTELRDLAARINTGKGSAGKLINDSDFYNNLNSTVDATKATLEHTNQLLATAETGPGTLGRAMSDPTLYNNAVTVSNQTRRAIASLDSTIQIATMILIRVQQGEGTLGKLTKDQALYDQMTATLDRLDKLVASIDRGDGTLGRLIHQETLAQETEALLIEMRTLIKDVKENPKKYFKVSVF